MKLVRGFGRKTPKIAKTVSDECASEPVVCGWKAVRNCRCPGDHELVLNLVDVVNEQLRARLVQFDLSNDADLLVLLKKSLRQATRSLELYESYKLITDEEFIAKVVELFAKYKPFKNGAMLDFDVQLRAFVASYLKQSEYSSVVNTVYCAISAHLFEHPSRKRNGRSF